MKQTIKISDATVSDLTDYLTRMNYVDRHKKLHICGMDTFYIHVNDDDDSVCIDPEEDI